MKYMICIDKIENGRLIGKSMRLISAPDPSILTDAALYMVAADHKTKKSALTTSKMPLSWTHNNNPNSKDRGCKKIRHIGIDEKELHWILYYKQVRDHEVICIKEEGYGNERGT
jgi:hypothetical protein